MRKRYLTTLLALALCVPTGWAQQKDPRVNPPVAPYPPLSAGESSSKVSAEDADTFNATAADQRPVVPDRRSLTGVERFTLFSPERGRSYLLPSFEFAQTVDTNAASTTGAGKTLPLSTLRGRVALQRVWGRYQLTANYAGSGSLYNQHSELNTSFHQVSMVQKIAWRRWNLLLGNQFTYLPESSFGTAGFGWFDSLGSRLGDAGTNLTTLNPLFSPNQTILTNRAARLSDTFVGQVQYSLNPRSSITASGSYGILHFMDPGFINEKDATFATGYNYALTSRDTLALVYGLRLFRFDGRAQPINSHAVQLGYGRRVSGRLAVEIFAGPQIDTFSNSLAGSDQLISWSARTALRYRLPRSDFHVAYSRGLSGGAGLLAGAQNNLVETGFSRQLSRMWAGSWNFGYSRNTSLRQITPSPDNRAFNAWYTGASLSRPLGRYTRLFLAYNLQRQSTNTPVCTVAGCSRVLLRQHFGIGFNWSMRPIQID